MAHRLHLVAVQASRVAIPPTPASVPLLKPGTARERRGRRSGAAKAAVPLYIGVASGGVEPREKTRALAARPTAAMASRLEGRPLRSATSEEGALKVAA